MLGQCLYSALWLVAIAALFGRLLGSRWGGALATLLLAAITAAVDHNILVTIWFPDLYFLPFATFFLACTRLLSGRGDSLVLLALALGTLVNGHAAFAPICGLLGVLVLVANAVLARSGLADARVASLAFVRANARALWLVAGVGLLFALPLLLETAARWPGPVADYLAFGRAGQSHAFDEGARYVAHYWSDLHLLVPGAALALCWAMLVLSGRARGAPELDRAGLALLATAALATGVVVAYAIYGIDLLSETYVAIFYIAVPACVLAWFAVAFFAQARAKPRGVAFATIAALALASLPERLALPAGNASDYDMAGIADADARLRAQPAPRIVLDLDDSAQWGTVWSTVAGLLVHAAREGDGARYCVGAHWHILFTRRAACAGQDLAGARVLRVSAAAQAGEPVARVGPVGFYETTPAR